MRFARFARFIRFGRFMFKMRSIPIQINKLYKHLYKCIKFNEKSMQFHDNRSKSHAHALHSLKTNAIHDNRTKSRAIMIIVTNHMHMH